MGNNYDFFRNPEIVKMEKEYFNLNKKFIKIEKEYESVLDGEHPNASYELEKELEQKLLVIRDRMNYLSGAMENITETKIMKKRIIITESQMNMIKESISESPYYNVEVINHEWVTDAPDGEYTYEDIHGRVLVARVNNNIVEEIIDGRTGNTIDFDIEDIDTIERMLNGKNY